MRLYFEWFCSFIFPQPELLVRQALIHRNILPALQVSDVVMYLPLPASGVFILIYEVANLLDDWKRETPAGEEVKKND